MLNIPTLERLRHELSRLPGIGPKSAQRLIHFILKNRDFSLNLREALMDVESHIRLCTSCFSYTDQTEECYYCQNPQRRSHFICVVEEAENISQIDASGAFDGRFHVLHGVISPLQGVRPEDLKIKQLIERIDQLLAEQPQLTVEVLLALDSDLEGDTTMLYLAKVLASRPQVKVSRLAQGVPIGSHLDFVDHRTLSRALENRITL
ncbi:MAG: recombination mediator RecR [Bdellovibrionales bacterium]|nr:recombination mediator RecR [Bdellovibrionales bacterium]